MPAKKRTGEDGIYPKYGYLLINNNPLFTPILLFSNLVGGIGVQGTPDAGDDDTGNHHGYSRQDRAKNPCINAGTQDELFQPQLHPKINLRHKNRRNENFIF